ncbi:MAG: hypothetical protein IJU93_06280 [Lachnospiraceae bacterium]|nr:hypothetical protein [Lachnospiraceae bacterium]
MAETDGRIMTVQTENAYMDAARALKNLADAAKSQNDIDGNYSAFGTAKTLSEAAEIAKEYCDMWIIFGDEDETKLNEFDLSYAAGQQDLRVRLPMDDPAQYYLVKGDGAVGLTTDGEKTIEWIFSPKKN